MLIDAAELTAELAGARPCTRCSGGLGVHVDPAGGWSVVVLHAVGCRGGLPPRRHLAAVTGPPGDTTAAASTGQRPRVADTTGGMGSTPGRSHRA